MDQKNVPKSESRGLPGGPMNRGGWGAMGMPVEKAKDFKGTLLRLLGYFYPERFLLITIIIAAVIGMIFSIVGPKILGLATTKLFENLLASYLIQVRNKLNPSLIVPVPGIEFGYIGNVLLLLLGMYVLSSVFLYVQQYLMAGIAQRA
jgi:ATP-binding cassette subfamily B protein